MIDLKPRGECVLHLRAKPCDVKKLMLAFENRMQPIPQELAQQAEQVWKVKCAEHPHLFNGTIANLLAYEEDNDAVRLTANYTDYKTYTFLNAQPFYTLFDHGIAILGTSAILITKDQKIIIAKRGKDLIGEGLLHTLPGGTCSVEDGMVSVERTVLKELEEELGIIENEVQALTFHGIGYDGMHAKGAELLFSIRTGLTAEEVIARQAHAHDRDEASELQAIDLAALQEFIAAYGKQFIQGNLAAIKAYLAHTTKGEIK